MNYPDTDDLYNGKFTDGDPVAGYPASVDSAAYMNAVYDELLAVIESAGITPDVSITNQLLTALNTRYHSDATTTKAGIVRRSTDADALAGQGDGVVSPQQLKQTLGQFGLFGTAASFTDFDTQVNSGFFTASSAVLNPPVPSVNGWFLTVLRGSEQYLYQTAHDASAVNRTFTRSKTAGAWSKWAQVTTGNDIQRSFVGMIADFQIAAPRPGWLNANGGEVSRTTDSILWQYAQDSGMTVSQAAKDADPMKYAAYFGDGDGSTTFTLPNFHLGHFRRGTPSGVTHGATQGDAMRNLVGQFGAILGLANSASGVFTGLAWQNNQPSAVAGGSYAGVKFDASLVVPTADENRPYTANISVKIFRGWI